MAGNPYIQKVREPFAKELEDPNVRLQVAAMLASEGDAIPLPVAEALMNRVAYQNSIGIQRTLLQELHGGFYGPINRHQLASFMAMLKHNPGHFQRLSYVIDQALAGSDVLHGFTDQGLRSDPNGQHEPQIYMGGNIFNDWGGGRGHASTAAWREAFEAGAVKALQVALNNKGITVSVDGVYGPATLEAVKNFQEAHALTADGVPGPETWLKLTV